MDDNDEIVTSDAFEEIDECFVKIEPQIDLNQEETTANYFDFNLEDEFLEMEESKLRRSKRIKQTKSSNAKLQSRVFKPQPRVFNPTTVEQNLRSKYRPIRPKPCATSDKLYTSKNKLLGISSALNMSPLSPPSRIIVTSISGKNKIQDVTVLDSTSSRETCNYIKSVNGIPTLTKETNNDKNRIEYPKVITVGQDQRNAKILSKSPKKNSIEMFFDSMAQAVSKLPVQMQAEIKMEICKLVTMAEINHYGSQLRYKTS